MAAASTAYQKSRAKIVAALEKAGVQFVVGNPRARRGYIDIELAKDRANLNSAEAVLVAIETPQWAGIANSLATGEFSSQSVGNVSLSLRDTFAAAPRKSDSPEDLVDAYTIETSKLQSWKSSITPATMPSGAPILALDAAGRAKAALAAFARLGKKDTPGWHSAHMLAALLSVLLRAKLPFSNAELTAILESSADAELPRTWYPDFDRLAVELARKRRGKPTPAMAKAIKRLAAKRNRTLAPDRRVQLACANVLSR